MKKMFSDHSQICMPSTCCRYREKNARTVDGFVEQRGARDMDRHNVLGHVRFDLIPDLLRVAGSFQRGWRSPHCRRHGDWPSATVASRRSWHVDEDMLAGGRRRHIRGQLVSAARADRRQLRLSTIIIQGL